MKKNAFTLIELLAVIVILAIIALIAVPILINIINDSKKSSDEQSVELYIDTVEKTITKKQLSNPNFNPDKCEIQNDGNLKCYKNGELISGKLYIDMKGSMPSSGSVIIKDNKIKFKNIVFNGEIYYEKYTELICDEDDDGEISIGDEYSYKVNYKDIFHFYVLSFNDNNTVNLIMDRNICGSATNSNDSNNGKPATEQMPCLIAWYIEPDETHSEAITAMQGLYNATKEWTNVPYNDMYCIIDNQTKKMKARVPMSAELNSNSVKESNSNLKYWLVNNLQYDSNYPSNSYPKKNNIFGITGYYIFKNAISNDDNIPQVGKDGCIYGGNHNAAIAHKGIRPVITVPREYLE